MKNKDLLEHLRMQGFNDEIVLEAMEKVPRHWFVRESLQSLAYQDEPLPIGQGQTISQPLVVAWMSAFLIEGKTRKKVLEIGTGSGYQAAVLSYLVEEVYTIERIKSLYEAAKERFVIHGFKNIHYRFGDGHEGWLKEAPFDGILVTAAAPEIPSRLIEQLTDGGRMVIPIGPMRSTQYLTVIDREGDELEIKKYDPVLFVPLLSGESNE